jgi:selenocysteine-specific elongation factor
LRREGVARKGPAVSRRREKTLAPPAGTDKEKLAAICRARGIRGVRERDLTDLICLNEEKLGRLGEELEAEGTIKILSFSPLFLISRESFDYLCEKLVAYLEEFHKGHPALKGVTAEKVKERFGISQMVLFLAVKTLEKAGKVRTERDRLMLSSHAEELSPQEEEILKRLEDLYYRGEFRSVSLAEIRREFRLSEGRLDRLVGILMERKKIFQGPEGLFIHSHWLDEVVAKVKASGKKELTVGEFKNMTALSRKYAIPLLELLDQLGVTRRKGSVREILASGQAK